MPPGTVDAGGWWRRTYPGPLSCMPWPMDQAKLTSCNAMATSYVVVDHVIKLCPIGVIKLCPVGLRL